jgi:hypothetical protein
MDGCGGWKKKCYYIHKKRRGYSIPASRSGNALTYMESVIDVLNLGGVKEGSDEGFPAALRDIPPLVFPPSSYKESFFIFFLPSL